MRPLIIPTVVALGAALHGCTGAPAVDLEAARASLREADRQYAQIGTSKDLEGFVAMYTADAAMYPPELPVAKGHEAIRATVGAFMEDPAFAISFTPGTVDVAASGDMGYTYGTANITITGPDGNPMSEIIRDFHLWKRQADGSWKVVVDIWNIAPM